VAQRAAKVVTMADLPALVPALVAALLAARSAAPMDWVYGTAASVVFVAAIAIPAAVLNSREHKRRQRERSAAR
jgi:hypothetical protein